MDNFYSNYDVNRDTINAFAGYLNSVIDGDEYNSSFSSYALSRWKIPAEVLRYHLVKLMRNGKLPDFNVNDYPEIGKLMEKLDYNPDNLSISNIKTALYRKVARNILNLSKGTGNSIPVVFDSLKANGVIPKTMNINNIYRTLINMRKGQ